MNRFFTIGLLASTMLVAVAPAAAQERGGNRSEWRGQSQQQQSGQRGGGSERQRDWSRPQRVESRERTQGEPRQQRSEGRPRVEAPARTQPAPQAAQQAPDRRAPSAVTTTRVRPSDAPRNAQAGNWQNNPRGTVSERRSSSVESTRRDQQPPRNWNEAGRNNSEWRQNNQARNDDRRQGDWNRDRAGNRDNDRRPNDWRNDDRRRDDARNGNYGRNGNDWSRQRDRNNQRDWSNQRRLNERDRWSSVNRWDNRWRNDRRYDWQRYRNQYRNVYRMPTYYAPSGWSYGYRRFSIGIYLNDLLFSSNYWIDDPYSYRLPAAYGPLRWVRYYDDAMLIDTRDGYVVDVIHNFFW